MKNRQNGKDIAKAIGIYLVITGHLLSAQAQAGHALIYLVHMPLFFWISGYFLYGSVKKHSIAENVRNKVDTLLIPFLVWSGVALLANLAVSFLNGSLGLQVICSGFYEVYIQARSMWFLLLLCYNIKNLLSNLRRKSCQKSRILRELDLYTQRN